MKSMQTAIPILTVAAVVAVVAVGCSGSGGDGGSTPTAPPADVEAVSAEMMADLEMSAGQMSEGQLDSEVREMNRERHRNGEFTRTRECPLGGEIVIDGRMTREKHGNVTELEGRGIRTENDCMIPHRGGETLTINGRARWESHHRLVDGRPEGPQTSHWSGQSTFMREDGRERTCRVEITITRNPSSGRRVLEGTICGHPVNRDGAWEPPQ